MDLFWWGIGGIVALLAFCLYMDIREERAWARFAEKNGCYVTEEIPGSVAPTISTNGSFGTTFVPGKKKWVCRDGSVHWR